MRVVFYLWGIGKQMFGIEFFECRHWAAPTLPKEGWKITFLLRSENSPELDKQIVMGTVVKTGSSNGSQAVWVDMGDVTQSLKERRAYVENWKRLFPLP